MHRRTRACTQTHTHKHRTLYENGIKECNDHAALWQAYGMLEVWKERIGVLRQKDSETDIVTRARIHILGIP